MIKFRKIIRPDQYSDPAGLFFCFCSFFCMLLCFRLTCSLCRSFRQIRFLTAPRFFLCRFLSFTQIDRPRDPLQPAKKCGTEKRYCQKYSFFPCLSPQNRYSFPVKTVDLPCLLHVYPVLVKTCTLITLRGICKR